MGKNKNDQTFEQWMKLVDKAVEAKIGMTTMDLPDIDFYDAYENGKSPSTTAVKCIKNADETY